MEKNKIKLNQLYSDYASEFDGEELVFGDGNTDSGIVMIGEAPGKDEVKLQKPFVGMAGGNLGKFMEYLSLSRSDLYVTNAIKYRLYKINEKTGRKSNRPARKKEILTSRPYLMKEIDVLRAHLVITLGNVPLKAVTGDFNLKVGDVHGQPIQFMDFTIIPLYHPASLIYNRNLEKEYYKDLDKLKKIISEV